MGDIEEQIWNVKESWWDSDTENMQEAISTLLEDPDFCPNGGLLGLPLFETYEAGPKNPWDIQEILGQLEGRDVVARSACENLGLDVSIKTAIEEAYSSDFFCPAWSCGRLLLDQAVDLYEYPDVQDRLLQHFMDNRPWGATPQLVHPYNGQPCYGAGKYNVLSKAIAWIRDLREGGTGYELEWPNNYDSDAEPDHERVHFIMVAAFGPAGQRSQWDDYAGEEFQGYQ
ncbi:hypothetical protein L218DRAFT_1018010 [Marasmius fiardii PR-910]|nr:hypothetical protein L218DRAFT_1018010 [Marasmius fiardii PR-910]